jgi:imidazoleglycerol-phosphate dehydratase
MANIERNTKETKIKASLNLYGEGKYNIDTKIGFFNHMIESMTKHSIMDLELTCDGDIEVDYHHSVEDSGIVIGKLLNDELFPIESIERFGEASIVMDEACVECVIDISNRPFLVFELPDEAKVGEFDCELVEEFFRALVLNASITVHLIFKRGKNKHHIIEAAFKAFAVALRRAIAKNDRVKVPSTKGIL